MNQVTPIVVLALLLLPATSQAQIQPSAGVDRRDQLVASAQKGAPFQEGRASYQVVVGLRAASRGGATGAARLSDLGVPAGDLVEEKGPFVVYARPPVARTASGRLKDASAVASEARSPSYPVVVNVQTGELGILPGVIVVKLTDAADAAVLASANGLTVDYVAAQIGYAFLHVPDGQDVVAAAAALARDPRVTTAYPEVREHFPQRR